MTDKIMHQPEPAGIEEKKKLRKAMGFWDLILFYIAAVVGLRWVATASKAGPSSIVIWVMAFIFFFIPYALTVAELSSRHPDEGGIYIWSKRAFGDFHGFMAGWTYWTSIIVYFPGLLFFAAGNTAYVLPGHTHLAEDKTYLALVSIMALAVALSLNTVGLNIGKWLHNASGSIGTWLPAIILISMGFIAWIKFGSASDFSLHNLVPKAGSVSWTGTFPSIKINIFAIIFWANIAFAFSGMESASVMGEEVRDAKRTIPRALFTAGMMITFIYIAGTVALLLALPQDKTTGLKGITDAINVTAERSFGQSSGMLIGSIAATLICIGNVGGVGAWIAATARLPFVMGIDRFMPSSFGKVHPRWGTPYVALLVEAGITVVLIVLAGLAGRHAEQAYQILVNLGVITSFVPYLYMFASLIVLQRESAGEGTLRIPGGKTGAYIAGACGFLITVLSIILACVPDESVEDKLLFFITVFGTVSLTIMIGLWIYIRGKRIRSSIGAE